MAVTTILYCHGNKCYQRFSTSISEYSFDISVFDIWITCVIRGAICLGLVLAFICNPTDTISRTKIWRPVPVLLCGTLIFFTLVKLLAISEVEDNLSDPWFWGIFSSAIIFSVFIVFDWLLISKTSLPGRLELLVNNNDDTETEPLLNKSTKTNDSGNNQVDGNGKKKKGTILRLLALSRPDLLFVVTAFIFLIVSATGMYKARVFLYYRVIALISADIVPSFDIEGPELASVSRYPSEGQYSPISV